MRRITSILLTAAILLTLSACGNAGESGSPAPESSVPEESPAPDVAAESTPESSASEESISAQEDVPEAAAPDNDTPSEAPVSQSEQPQSAPAINAANEQQQEQADGDGLENLRVKLSFDGNEVYVALYDSPPSRDLLSRLPLTLEFQDYAATEKISYLDQPLTADSGSNPPSIGDFAYYSPWGNLAIFYNDVPSADGRLVILGSMESGKELLAGMSENFTMTIEQVN